MIYMGFLFKPFRAIFNNNFLLVYISAKNHLEVNSFVIAFCHFRRRFFFFFLTNTGNKIGNTRQFAKKKKKKKNVFMFICE